MVPYKKQIMIKMNEIEIFAEKLRDGCIEYIHSQSGPIRFFFQ